MIVVAANKLIDRLVLETSFQGFILYLLFFIFFNNKEHKSKINPLKTCLQNSLSINLISATTIILILSGIGLK